MNQILSVILFLSSIAIIVAVLMQQSKAEGIASITGETNVGGQGGRKTKDNYLNQVVVVACVIFMITAIAIAALN